MSSGRTHYRGSTRIGASDLALWSWRGPCARWLNMRSIYQAKLPFRSQSLTKISRHIVTVCRDTGARVTWPNEGVKLILRHVLVSDREALDSFSPLPHQRAVGSGSSSTEFCLRLIREQFSNSSESLAAKSSVSSYVNMLIRHGTKSGCYFICCVILRYGAKNNFRTTSLW